MSWFPPLAGDQPNEPIIPIGQTEGETPEVEEGWTCPGCHKAIEPSDVRRHASECDDYDGSAGY